MKILVVLCSLFCQAAAAASISGFAPLFGQPGNIIVLTGSGFTGTTLVQFDNLTPADFDVNSDTQIAVVVPQGATSGPLSVTVGSSTASSSSSFLVAPIITAFNPASGASPTQVTITGANFITGATTVTFSGTNPPVNGTVVASTQVSAVVPTGATNGPITVTTSAGSVTSAASFIVSQLPVITDFSPSVGSNGTTVVIDGSNFITNATKVNFGSVAASHVTVVAATQIQTVVPPGAATAPITVTTPFGSVTTPSNFVTGGTAVITDFDPTEGGAGTYVTIDGFNFSSITSITIGGVSVPASAFSEVTLTQIQLAVPTGASTGPITIRGTQGTYTTTSNFVTSTGPIITDFSPILGPPGTELTIDGLNLGSVTTVNFGSVGVAVRPTAFTQIIVTTPPGATTGPLTVTSPTGSFTTASNFTVTSGAPFISGFSPSNGVRGMTVTITGGNFTNTASLGVQFNGASAEIAPLTSTSVLEATVPADATTGPITVVNNGGTTASAGFFYTQPWITNFIPASGVVGGAITIDGRNLLDAGTLSVNGIDYNFVGSATQIVATIPTNATTGLLTIVTPGGVVISTNAFTVLPAIYSINPTLGPVGTVVTISGTSLFNVTNVEFNGANATPFNVSSGQLQVAVPKGATNGPIRVVTEYGSAVSSIVFIVTGPSLVLLTNTAAPQIIIGPGNIRFTLLVTNEGPSIVTGVTVVDDLPSSLSFVSAASTVGTCSYTNDVVTCNIGVLDTNSSVEINIVTTVASTGALTNTALLSFVEGNLIPTFGVASAGVDALSDAQATLSIAPGFNASQIVLWWPVSAVSFVLETNSDLRESAQWQTNVIAPILSNGVNYVTNTLTHPPTFFRLRSQ